jgi:hypothetical protein
MLTAIIREECAIRGVKALVPALADMPLRFVIGWPSR